jgi:hypothetical protein
MAGLCSSFSGSAAAGMSVPSWATGLSGVTLWNRILAFLYVLDHVDGKFYSESVSIVLVITAEPGKINAMVTAITRAAFRKRDRFCCFFIIGYPKRNICNYPYLNFLFNIYTITHTSFLS